MTKEKMTYQMPNVGCMIGTAYQALLSKLSLALADAGLDITPAEYMVLRVLYDQEGLQQCEIAEIIGRDKAGVSRCVAGMEKKGLVRTEAVSHKCLRVYLSDKGRSVEAAVMDVANERHRALEGLVDGRDMEVFVKVLRTIIQQQ
ncbi:MAG: MarR family transcriptional regulator [Muribaculaceae bacterium]|nr:MarR family transcriptional regulator [Muribaculaceae bacterium]